MFFVHFSVNKQNDSEQQSIVDVEYVSFSSCDDLNIW